MVSFRRYQVSFFEMTKNEMPATEVSESASYELAFHVLPTVAEGEVPAVFENIKAVLTKAGVEITDEEAPERFDLAYEIVKYLEGRNRKFNSAYFGWVRFTALPEQIEEVNEAVEGVKELLRNLLVKLTKVEEENSFRFHEALEMKPVENVEAEEEKKEAPVKEVVSEEKEAEATESTKEDDSGEEAK